MSSYYSVQSKKTDTDLGIELRGRWTVAALAEIEQAFLREDFGGVRKIVFDGRGLEDFDTSAAWYLDEMTRRFAAQGISAEMKGFVSGHRLILDRVMQLPHEAEEARRVVPPLTYAVATVGEQMDAVWRDCRRGIGFLGEIMMALPRQILRPASFRLRSIVFHINETGIKAVPIIALMSFAIAFVTGYQGSVQLQKFDATIYTVDLIVLSTLREMGVLITAIMLAGRSGSAFAAQLGTMKINEEVDALQTMGVAPFDALVLPRIVAIIIALPLLTVIADMMGLFGGYIFSSSFLGYSWTQYLARVQEAAEMKHFYVGMVKAPFFGLLVGIVGCMQGLQARGSAEEVGRRTITAVVQAIFLVIVADALFSVIFTKMGV